MRERERDLEILYLIVCSLNGHNRQVWVRLKPGTSNFPVGGRGPSNLAISFYFSRHFSNELDQGWNSQDPTGKMTADAGNADHSLALCTTSPALPLFLRKHPKSFTLLEAGGSDTPAHHLESLTHGIQLTQ